MTRGELSATARLEIWDTLRCRLTCKYVLQIEPEFHSSQYGSRSLNDLQLWTTSGVPAS